jgi:alpha,alpha-trehalose phosphorylase
MAAWRDAADKMAIPYDEELGVHPQADNFLHHRRWDFAHTTPDQYPLLLSYPYYELYRSQIVKQADLVHALWLCGDRFDEEQKARDFAYYEAITVRDSSLSAAPQAVVAAEVGHVELAYDYFGETAFIDLRDLAGNTHDGLHIAALSGAWLVAVCGFGGLRDHGDVPSFAPRLASRLQRLAFRIMYRGRRLAVEIRPGEATYSVMDGHDSDEELVITHHGEEVVIVPGTPETRPLPPLPRRRPPVQPPGREPRRRHVEA